MIDLKKYLLLSLVSFSIFAKQTIYLPQGLDLKKARSLIQQKKRTNDIEFAFDIHEVLLQKNTKEQLQLAQSFEHKELFLKNIFNIPLITQLGALFWHWILNISPLQARKAEATSEQLVVIFNDAKQYELSKFVSRLANAQIVDQSILPIIYSLKKLGFTIRVASNIGKTVYQELKGILSKRNENIFDLFNKDAAGNEGKVVDYAYSQASKPNDQYFIEFQETYNPTGSKIIIFIDDKKKNIKAAIKYNMMGIHYQNAQQLKKDLIQLGIFS